MKLKPIWNAFRFALVICSFFWFGWVVGLIMIVISVEIN